MFKGLRFFGSSIWHRTIAGTACSEIINQVYLGAAPVNLSKIRGLTLFTVPAATYYKELDYLQLITMHNITYVVNCLSTAELGSTYLGGIPPANKDDYSDLSPSVGFTNLQLEDGIERFSDVPTPEQVAKQLSELFKKLINNNVTILFHCNIGVGRSAKVCAAFLAYRALSTLPIFLQSTNPQEINNLIKGEVITAFALIKSQRPEVNWTTTLSHQRRSNIDFVVDCLTEVFAYEAKQKLTEQKLATKSI